MYLSDITIHNFMAFKEAEMTFENGINLIIGDNGVGKTSALSAVSKVIACLIEKMFHKGKSIIDLTEVNTDVVLDGESVYDVKYNFPVKISCKIGVKGQKYFLGLSRDDRKVSDVYDFDIQMNKQQLQKICNERYPLFCYQKFDREWKTPDIYGKNKVTFQTGLSDRMDGYEGCLKNELDKDRMEDIIQQWCLKMSVMEYEKRGIIKEFRTFQNIIRRFMQVIEDDEKDFKISYSMKMSGLVYEYENTSIPLYELSTGYKALLSMIMELAYRTVILNPDISDDLEELPGIVLIDEIDAHLHPKWQWSVIDALRKVFPKVQFIIGTHSPIVISSAKDARIISLDKKDGINYLESAYGYSINDVVTLRQGSTDMPEEAKRVFELMEEALDEKDMNKAQQVVDRAQKAFGVQSAIYKELKQYYDLNCLVED